LDQLQGSAITSDTSGGADTNQVHTIKIIDGTFIQDDEYPVESNDTLAFENQDGDTFDIIQVFPNGQHYFEAVKGFKLYHISKTTPLQKRCIKLSLELQEPTFELHFGLVKSSIDVSHFERHKVVTVLVHRHKAKLTLEDQRDNQKVLLHEGDCIEITWASKRSASYYIQMKEFCPASNTMYSAASLAESTDCQPATQGKFTMQCNNLGMFFFIRYDEHDQIHDVIVCLVTERYCIKSVCIKHDWNEPNLIMIRKGDIVQFSWDGHHKQRFVQIDPFAIDPIRRSSIEVAIRLQDSFIALLLLSFSLI
jgi:hypothetical protein